ncbi:DNA helicase [Microbacterium suaedae]|uniref:DNA helicase n=1 Tax=Microbacterium suaedae TaxID=2067813 RepID=UPI001E3006A8|nr:DNA helicase [Microbacterium suaedae]
MSVSLSRKRKKELRKLQGTANKVLEAQRAVAAEAADVARAAGRQLGAINQEVLAPEARRKYHEYVEPYVDRARPYAEDGYRKGKKFFDGRVIPAAGGVIGRAIGAYDATAAKLGRKTIVVEPPKKKSSAGAVIAAVLGIAAAVGIFVVAWKTLSAEDELWVADEAVAAPDA